MARSLFGEASDPTGKVGSRAWLTLPVSIAVHVVLLLVVVTIPLVTGDLLPMPRPVIAFTAPEPLPDPPPPSAALRPSTSEPSPAENASPAAPATAPDSIEPENPPAISVAAGAGVEGGLIFGDVPGGGRGVLNIPPSPTPPPVQPAITKPLPIGGNIRTPVKVHHVSPGYPRIAQDARVEGTVVIEAIIGVDGRVTEARILVSKPRLDQAALDAVRQWRFTPTLLNGVPVPVIMTVRVAFSLH